MKLSEATVLIVEDEPLLREVFCEWMKRVAGTVLSAHHGAEALAIMEAQTVDLMVSDLRMPIMDGLSLLRKIKAADMPAPAIIFVSGFSDLDARDAYDLGVQAILEKPIERRILLQAVERSLKDRTERWQTPTQMGADMVLNTSFASLDEAVREGQIVVGFGGFCIAGQQIPQEGPIDLRLTFKAENLVLTGQGVVRWTAADEAGIEVLYLDENSRAWFQTLIPSSGNSAFIPRTAQAVAS